MSYAPTTYGAWYVSRARHRWVKNYAIASVICSILFLHWYHTNLNSSLHKKKSYQARILSYSSVTFLLMA